MKQKLLINCKIGDPVYIVNTKSKSDSGILDCIRQYFIKDIIHHGNGIFTAGTTYKLEKISLHYTDKYEFNHSSSIDDELIVDSEHGYGKDGDRIYTTYQGALDYLISDIKCDILKQLRRLEYIEEHLGTSDNSSIVIRTKKMEYNWHKINKREIYEDIYSDDANKDIQEINEKLKNQKIEVWKNYVEYDGEGETAYSSKEEYFHKAFDTLEEAEEWIWKNDKSRGICGKNNDIYEGYHYYIKIPEVQTED